MRPSRDFLRLLSAWLILAAPLAVLRMLDREALAAELAVFWWLAGGFTGLYALIDLLRSRVLQQVSVQRTLPSTLAVGVPQTITLKIKNPLPQALSADITDHWPAEIQLVGMPVTTELPANNITEIHYQIIASQRGSIQAGQVDMRLRSQARLWDLRFLKGEPGDVRIYPNFAPVFNSQALSVDQQINRLGAHAQPTRGAGMDFHQLREFREGDSLRQVDWKASSRLHKLISREYQFEKDQDIIFLMDCGRRMRAQDASGQSEQTQLSHFDHALNAMLLTAWIALRQGDAVGLQSFAVGSGQQERWLTPGKGQTVVNQILQLTYDLHSSTNTSDFLEAAEQLLSRHRKRALVVLVSNIREEDRDDLHAATSLLKSKHKVMVASLREQVLDTIIQEPVDSFDRALDYAGTRQYLDQRQKLFKELRSSGVLVVDARPDTMHVDMVNQYLQLKSSGLI